MSQRARLPARSASPRTCSQPARCRVNNPAIVYRGHPAPPVATIWPGTGQALLIAQVSPSDIPSLRPGFVRWHGAGSLGIPHHPCAALRLRHRRAHLFINDRVFAPTDLPRWWPSCRTSILAVLPALAPGPSGDTAIDRFFAALDDQSALLAEIPVELDTP